jgi:hypothetical protein
VTTVGYGREVTETFIGRMCAFFLAVLGLVMSSMFFAAVSQKLSPTMYQKYALKWLEDSRFERVSRQVAAAIIQLQWRYFKFQQVKHTMPTIARRRLESMFKLKSWLFSARFQKMRNDHKTGTQTEAFLDYTDLTILRRVTLVDKHLTSRFQWLDNRLHAMMLEVLRAANPKEDEQQIRNRARAASFARASSGPAHGGGADQAGQPRHPMRSHSNQPHFLNPSVATGHTLNTSVHNAPAAGAPSRGYRQSHRVAARRGGHNSSSSSSSSSTHSRDDDDNGNNNDDDNDNNNDDHVDDGGGGGGGGEMGGDQHGKAIDPDNDDADTLEAKIFGRSGSGARENGVEQSLDDEFENALKFVASEASIDSS